MAKLPAMRKVTTLVYRRRGPDDLLVVRRPGRDEWMPPFTLAEEGENPEDAARRLAEELTRGDVLATTRLSILNAFVIKNGPSAGDWTEAFVGVEVSPASRPLQGAQWLPHFEAKAATTAVKAREAITELRARVRLLP